MSKLRTTYPHAMWGVCVNARNQWASADDLHTIGAGVVRSIVYNFDEFDDRITYEPPGTQIIALINRETEGVEGDFSGWEDVVRQFAARFGGRVDALECDNEWDLNEVPEDVAADLARQALGPCRAAGIKVLLGSVAGADWMGSLKRACSALSTTERRRLAGVCIHPYGQRAGGWPDGFGFGELSDVIDIVFSIAQRPVWITEYGIKLEDCGSVESQAIYFTRARQLFYRPSVPMGATCFFAWSDAVGGPDESFGLRDRDGNARPAYGAAVACSAIMGG
jgi:hypothetical protein